LEDPQSALGQDAARQGGERGSVLRRVIHDAQKQQPRRGAGASVVWCGLRSVSADSLHDGLRIGSERVAQGIV